MYLLPLMEIKTGPKSLRKAEIGEGAVVVNVQLLRCSYYLFKVNNGNIKRMCKICSKLAIKTLERCQ